MKLLQVRLLPVLLSVLLFANSAQAHRVTGAIADIDCDQNQISVSFEASSITQHDAWLIEYELVLVSTDNLPDLTFNREVGGPKPDILGNVAVTDTFAVALAGGYTVSGTATFYAAPDNPRNEQWNTIPITNGDGSIEFGVECNLPLASLGDFLFEDSNANGIQDPSEIGIDGARVTLLEGDCNTETGMQTITENGGIYRFADLLPGQYCVEFELFDICDPTIGQPQFTTANVGINDNIDSDVNSVGITTPVTLNGGDLDLSLDAGIYCPAKIGDQVWLDDDSDGLQSGDVNNEPGVADVTVNLQDCFGNSVSDLDGNSSITTDNQGMYAFRVKPGDYVIEFIDAQARSFTQKDAGSDDSLDSDANAVTGKTNCTSVISNTYDSTQDAGLVLPEPCGLGVDKTCSIVAPVRHAFSCEGKIDSLTMIYDESKGALLNVQAFAGSVGSASLPVTIEGNRVSVSGYVQSGAPNDVVWSYEAVNGSGVSTFHRSCSDDEMDGETDNQSYPNDCSRPQGNGKGNGSGDNVWLLDGLSTERGSVLTCSPSEPVYTDNCSFEPQMVTCDTLPNKPEVLSFQYSGGGCAASNNSQKTGDATCSGQINSAEPVTVMYGGQTVHVAPGEVFDIPRDDADEIELQNSGGVEYLTLHTSCSQPLVSGEVYGSLTLTALDGNGMGKTIQYSYTVENNGLFPVSDIQIVDNLLGSIADGLNLLPGEQTRVTASSYISSTTTNDVLVTGDNGSSQRCEATDSVTVTILPPPPCSVSGAFNKLDDDKLKFKITNSGARMATLDTFVLSFPEGYESIKEIKLDGAIYKSDKSALNVTSGVIVSSEEWTSNDVTKRQLEPGETRTLEVRFTKKQNKNLYKGDIASNFVGSIHFEEGCFSPL